ncbi:MAG: hypothetical protein WCW14_03345, partial [Candidatus Paceibacterota bacterium]
MKLTIPRWFDRHLHLRDEDVLKIVLPCTLLQRATGAIIMGNLTPPDETSTIEKAKAYQRRIVEARDAFFHAPFIGGDFKPCMTCYLTDDISPEEVVRGFEEGVWCAVKLYMADQK